MATTKEKPNKGEVKRFPVEKVKPAPDFNTRVLGIGDISDLKASIERKGLMYPLIGREMDSGDVMFHVGYRRFAALVELGWTEIPVEVVPRRSKTNKDMLVENVTENIIRQDLNPVDEAKAFERMRESYGMTPEEISQDVGVKLSRVRSRLGLLKMSAVVQDALHHERIPLAAAKEISRLPVDLHVRYVGLAEDFSSRKICKLVEKELEKIQAPKEKKEKAEKKPTTAMTEWVRLIKGRLKALAEATGVSLDELDGMEWRLHEEDELGCLAKVLDACVDMIPEEVLLNEKSAKEILRYVEGVEGKVLDMASSQVRGLLQEGIGELCKRVAVAKAEETGKRPKITFAIVQGVLDNLYGSTAK